MNFKQTRALAITAAVIMVISVIGFFWAVESGNLGSMALSVLAIFLSYRAVDNCVEYKERMQRLDPNWLDGSDERSGKW